MQAKHEIERQLENFKENQLIFASQLYRHSLSDTVSESAYYKTLERMCQQNALAHVSRGIYRKPARGKYGIFDYYFLCDRENSFEPLRRNGSKLFCILPHFVRHT